MIQEASLRMRDACDEFLARARPFLELRARVMMLCPPSFVQNGQELEPVYSYTDIAQRLLNQIDEALEYIRRDTLQKWRLT